MSIDSPLSKQYLSRYPDEAARVLEQVSISDVTALFNEISVQTVGPVLSAMLPSFAASCLSLMEAPQAARLLSEIPVNNAARIFRLLNQDRQKEISANLGGKQRKRIRNSLSYRSLSAGDLMNPDVDMLPDNLTVADAIRRIGRHRQGVKCEIYIVDQAHRFLGVVDLAKLLTSRQHARLKDIMSRSIKALSAHASAERLLTHPAWVGRQRLPIVESDNILVGILDYTRIKDAVGKEDNVSHDPVENLYSLAGLYWMSMVHLLDSLLTIASVNKEEKL